MCVIRNKRRKGVAFELENHCISFLKNAKYYLQNTQVIDTSDAFNRCFHQYARTKKQAKGGRYN